MDDVGHEIGEHRAVGTLPSVAQSLGWPKGSRLLRVAPLAFFLVACGGTSAPLISLGADAEPASEDDASPLFDARADSKADDAGAKPDAAVKPDANLAPNQLKCGNEICALPSQYCCQSSSFSQDAGGFVTSLKCATGFSCAGSALRCLSAANCGGGEVCCFGASGGVGMPPSSCRQGQCFFSETQACASQPECKSGTCAAHQCQGGGTVNACAPIPGVCN